MGGLLSFFSIILSMSYVFCSSGEGSDSFVRGESMGFEGSVVGDDSAVAVGLRLLFAERIAILPSARMAFPVFCSNIRKRTRTQHDQTMLTLVWDNYDTKFFIKCRFKLDWSIKF